MIKLSKRIVVLCSVLVISGLCLAGSANAGALEDAKAAGYLGEKPDGYLGLVTDSAPKQVVDLSNEINLKRRAKYREIAEKNQTNLKSVEAVVGQKLVQRAKPGEFVLGGDGNWVRK